MPEDYGSPMSRSTHDRRSATSRRPSAIPRPSMTQERTPSGSSQKGGTGGKVPTAKRTRTHSTPYPYDRDSGGAAIPALPTPSDQDQIHPATPSSPRKADDRSSKIPKASGGLRSDSYGGSGSFYLQTRINSTQRQPPDQQMEVDESGAIPYSISYKNRNTQILNEPPPFSPSVSSMLSSDLQYEQSRLVGVYIEEAAPRPSTDSVERPFEHWYRGESTRNGGVGELRVGRSEMLDIAQFGHRPQPRVNPMSGVVTMSVANAASLFVSRRAGSLDRSRSGDRESWFIDDKTRDVMGFGGGKVMDESPLTDLEDVDGTTEGPESVIGHRGRQRESWRSSGRQRDNTTQSGAAQEQHSTRSTSTPPFASMDAILQQQPPPMTSSTSMGTTASLVRENSKKSAKSTKSSKSTTITAGRRTPTSTRATSITSSKGAAAANSTPSAVRSVPVSKVPTTTQKTKAKAAAKPKPRPAPKSTPAATSEPDHPASESTTDDTLVDAIPVFFTPMPRGGNWDDMILPTVAKKLGIEGYGLRTENGVVAKNDVVLPSKRATLVLPVSSDKICSLRPSLMALLGAGDIWI